MKNFEELENFIKNTPNWIHLLKKAPYSLKSINQFPYNKNWYMLVYNLFESDLSNPIVKQCRGTVVEVIDNGSNREVNIICAPFLKFFNWNEEYSDFKKMDWKSAKIQEKIDGQICKCFKYNGKDYWVTNGSTGLNTLLNYTTNEVSSYPQLLAKALMMPYMNTDYTGTVSYSNKTNTLSANLNWVHNIPDGYTVMFELTSPQNRIIVDYDKIELFLIGCRDNEGNELTVEEAKERFNIPYNTPKVFDIDNDIDSVLELLSKMDGSKEEGVVVCDKYFNRIKIKCDSYLQMKFVRDNLTPKGIFELVINENYDDILPKYSELKEQVENQIKQLNILFDIIRELEKHSKITATTFDTRKDFALWVKNSVKNELQWIYFSAVDNKDVVSILKEKFKNDGYEKFVKLREILVEND